MIASGFENVSEQRNWPQIRGWRSDWILKQARRLAEGLDELESALSKYKLEQERFQHNLFQRNMEELAPPNVGT